MLVVLLQQTTVIAVVIMVEPACDSRDANKKDAETAGLLQEGVSSASKLPQNSLDLHTGEHHQDPLGAASLFDVLDVG
jgi:hypothetical protein